MQNNQIRFGIVTLKLILIFTEKHSENYKLMCNSFN
jgi:hypothetical protein